MKTQHLILTRYTLKRRDWSYELFSPEWLEERLRLFRTYCVPGMERQTQSDYSAWLIFCDETTDPSEVEKIESSVAALPRAAVATTSFERGVGIPETVAAALDDDTKILITTSLDSDDCLHPEMVATVRSYAEAFAESGNDRLFVNFPRGYRYDEDATRFYAITWLGSVYSSLFERVRPGTEISTINKGNHHRFHHHTSMHYDYSIPGWMQVIHGLAETEAKLQTFRGRVLSGGNKSSYVLHTDVEVDRSELLDSFGTVLDGSKLQSSIEG